MKPAIEQLHQQLEKLGTPNAFETAKFTADSGFHSEANLEYMATTGLDSYIADTQFRSRNPLFKTSETYHTAQEKRRLKRSKGRPRLFTHESFHFDPTTNTCVCPAGKPLWRQATSIITKGKSYSRFTGYLKDCRVCPLQKQCMRKPPKSTGRQVQFLTDKAQYISHSDRMKIKIDSSAGRRQYSKRLGTIGR